MTAAPSTATPGRVVAVCRSGRHGFSKPVVDVVRLLPGLGVEGDAHAGRTVQHRSRVRRDPTAPNLRQVHLLHRELLDALAREGYAVVAGALGENLTTDGVPLLDLPTGTRLRIGAEAVVRVTGLRNPCTQIDGLGDGLMRRLAPRSASGGVERLAGIMGVVEEGGLVRPGDAVVVTLPAGPHTALQPV